MANEKNTIVEEITGLNARGSKSLNPQALRAYIKAHYTTTPLSYDEMAKLESYDERPRHGGPTISSITPEELEKVRTDIAAMPKPAALAWIEGEKNPRRTYASASTKTNGTPLNEETAQKAVDFLKLHGITAVVDRNVQIVANSTDSGVEDTPAPVVDNRANYYAPLPEAPEAPRKVKPSTSFGVKVFNFAQVQEMFGVTAREKAAGKVRD